MSQEGIRPVGAAEADLAALAPQLYRGELVVTVDNSTDKNPQRLLVAKAEPVDDTSFLEAPLIQVSSAEKTAGTETDLRTFSPKDIADMAGTHGGGGGGGSLGQVIQTVDTTNRSTSAASQQDTGIQAVITPTSASSKVLVTVSALLGNGSAASGRAVRFNIDRGGTDLTPAGANGNWEDIITAGTSETRTVSFSFLDSPATTSATTYKLQWTLTSTGVTVYLGRRGADTVIDCPTYLTLQEVV